MAKFTAADNRYLFFMATIEIGKEKAKRGIISKTLHRCKSLGGHRNGEKRCKAPEGCFSVYVGEGKERFVVRTQWLNHPLFRSLLDEAESEYGYAREGPLELPCDVELFQGVLAEVAVQEEEEAPRSSSFGRNHMQYQMLKY